jgi:hypothetical protein
MAPTSTSSTSTYEHVGRQAWVILWLAFAIFLLLITGGPLGVRWYVHHATRPMTARVEAVVGTTLVLQAKNNEPLAVLNTNEIREKDRVRTDQNSRANLILFDSPEAADSLASVQLRTNSEIELVSARRPRFQRSKSARKVVIKLLSGRARVTTGYAGQRAMEVIVLTPQGSIRIHDGSAAIAVSNENTEVTTRSGEVTVEAKNRVVVLSKGRRTRIVLGQPPEAPQAADKNLVKNGDFSQPLTNAWQMDSSVDARDLSHVTFGTVDVVSIGGRRAAYFQRDSQGEDAKLHSETAIIQQIDTDVLDAESLIFRMDARLIHQSLPGGGIQSSEFPLMVRIDFIDVSGAPQFWTHGFYIQDPEKNWPLRDGEKIPALVWFAYESPDFMQSDTFPRPARVTSLKIYASGHNYRSQAADIELIAK